MKYNFDEIVDRKGSYSAKYDELEKNYGRSDIIPMWIADMDFVCPKSVVDACVKRAEHGIFGYVSKPDSYKEAAILFEMKRHNWAIDKDELSFAVGIVPAMSELVREFTEPGDKVLIQTPVYPEFYQVVEAWEGREVIENQLVNRNGKYEIDFDDFEEKLKEGPKLFLFCNPHNPVGRIWSEGELTKLLKLCVEYGVPVVADEIHGDMELFGNKYTPVATLSGDIRKNTMCCFSASKTFNLAGLQACFVAFHNKEWKERFDSFWGGLDIHRNNCFSLVAMDAAWRYGEEWLDQVISYVEGNMVFLKEYLEANIPQIKFHLPEATYLAWLDCNEIPIEKKKLKYFFADEAGVALGDGRSFCKGLEGFMRMNLATPRPTLEKALNQIKEAVESLK